MLTLAGKAERLRRLLSMKEDYVRLLIEQDSHQEALQVCNQIAGLKEYLHVLDEALKQDGRGEPS